MALDASNGTVLWKKSYGDGRPDPKGFRSSVPPLVHGEVIYAHLGSGSVVALGPDGEEVWHKKDAPPWADARMGRMLMAGQQLIVPTHLRGKEKKSGALEVMALSPSDGTTSWISSTPQRRTLISENFETSKGTGVGVVAMTLQRGELQRDLLITGDGVVLDAKNGERLHRDIFEVELNRSTPVVRNDVVYMVSVIGEEAIRLWLDASGQVGTTRLWANRHTSGRGSLKANHKFGREHTLRSPLIHGGQLFQSIVDRGHVPQHWPFPWHEIDIWDLDGGQRLNRLRAVMRECTDPTIPLSSAGTTLVAGDGGAPVAGFHGTTDYGQLSFLETGDQPRVISTLRTRAYRSRPVFVGKTLYHRDFKGLHAIEVQGQEGEELVQKTVANTLLDSIPNPPEKGTLVRVEALETVTEEAPRSMMRLKTVPSAWIMAGPYPSRGDPLADPSNSPHPGHGTQRAEFCHPPR